LNLLWEKDLLDSCSPPSSFFALQNLSVFSLDADEGFGSEEHSKTISNEK